MGVCSKHNYHWESGNSALVKAANIDKHCLIPSAGNILLLFVQSCNITHPPLSYSLVVYFQPPACDVGPFFTGNKTEHGEVDDSFHSGWLGARRDETRISLYDNHPPCFIVGDRGDSEAREKQ